MKKLLVSVRYGIEVEVPELHQYETDEKYAEARALLAIQNNAEYIDPLVVEVVG